MQVLDYDRFSRDDPIGEIAIPLCDADLATGQTMWKVLQPCKGGSVCYIMLILIIFLHFLAKWYHIHLSG